MAEQVKTYKRVSYDVEESHRKEVARAALEHDTKQNAIVRALFELFVEDPKLQKRAIEIAKR